MKKTRIISCVTPASRFQYGIHKPEYTVTNLRQETTIGSLGVDQTDTVVKNQTNFPQGDIEVSGADWIFEIPNPLPFRGRTFIDKEWADNSAANPQRIALAQAPPVSFSKTEKESGGEKLLERLDLSLQLALATTSTDPKDLIRLARICCEFSCDKEGHPQGLKYQIDESGRKKPIIHNHDLFEAVANNPYLPEPFRIGMVIRPGAQGDSEIVGDFIDGDTHIYEYLRRNSYISGGHYAANMAEDSIRYSTTELNQKDMQGLRHLYYQRTYVRLGEQLGISCKTGQAMSTAQLETLRKEIIASIDTLKGSPTTLWGWNYGFDFAPSGYRLHASHQQIHQQYAIIPDQVPCYSSDPENPEGSMPAYSCGDLVAEWIERYKIQYNSDFFKDYRRAIATNSRMDGRDDLDAELVVWQDSRVMLFVPKAQTSQWELQIMTLPDQKEFLPGNIVECDPEYRASLDRAILYAQKALAKLGARMVTSIEFPKRIGAKINQPLLYSLLPRLPQSPGAFSEAQLRFINGHYPEDFASRCRQVLSSD